MVKRPPHRQEGSVLVAIVLFLFLGEVRSAVVVIVTLPLAMLIAFLLMNQFGLSANLMSGRVGDRDRNDGRRGCRHG